MGNDYEKYFTIVNYREVKNELKIGELYFRIDLVGNCLNYARFFITETFEHTYTDNLSLYIMSLAAFYEILFKYKMYLADKTSVWGEKKPFNNKRFNDANFGSIKMCEAAEKAKKKNWVTESEYDLIMSAASLRNRIAHFETNEPGEPNETNELNFRCIRLEPYYFEKHRDLVIKLLKDNESIFNSHETYKKILCEIVTKIH